MQMNTKLKNSEETFKYLSSISIGETGYAEAQFKMGVICHNNGLFSQAIQYYEKVMNNPLFSPEIFYNLGICYYGINNIERAIDLFFKAIEEKNDFKDAIIKCCSLCVQLGVELHRNQRIDEALELYLKCLCMSFGTQHIDILRSLAGAYAVKGEITNAVKCTIKALELDPMNVFAYAQLAKFRKFTNEDNAFVQQMELLLNRYTHEEEHFIIASLKSFFSSMALKKRSIARSMLLIP
jgi:tetratricopeptide (TPR) repeat protein